MRTSKILRFKALLLLGLIFSIAAHSDVRQRTDQSPIQESWAIDAAHPASINLQHQLLDKIKFKRDITVAVVDTGIDPAHPLIQSQLYTDKGSNKADISFFGRDFSKDASDLNKPFDSHGHGTHITGIIASVFKQVKIITLKYYNPNALEQDNLNSTVKALEYAVDLGVDIINYSSGGAGASLEELRVLNRAKEKGILVVAAAGNYGSNIDKPENHYYPASYGLSNIITVVNHDQTNLLNSTSNYGQSADISAPGSRIISALPSGRFGYLSGTSQSTAFVSGIAAILMSAFPELKHDKVKEIILASAKKIPSLVGKCKSAGILDASKAIELALGINPDEQFNKSKESILSQEQLKKQREVANF
jgi:thermitase